MVDITTNPEPSIKKRVPLAWSLWDWGSSSFNAVVTAFVFSVYITSEAFGPEAVVSAKLGTSLLITGIVVALLAPVVGRLSDAAGRRKTWLGINTAVVIAANLLLVFVAPEESYLTLGLVLLAVGNVAYEFAAVSYNAMLTQVATPRNVGRVSGFGWGIGYLGSIVLLGIILVGFIYPEVGWFGVTAEDGWDIRIAMVVTAAWFAVFAIPIFFAVPEIEAAPGSPGTCSGLLTSYRDLARSIADLWRNRRQVLGFLVASAVFRDGIAGATAFGGVIAARSFGFNDDDVIVFGIIAIAVAGVATILVGLFEDRIGAKRIMVWSLAIMVVASLILFVLDLPGAWSFWIFGLALCLFMGPIQSASRSFLTRLIPPGREGEIFGLYATTGRAASFLTPAAFTLAVTLGGDTISGALGLTAVLLLGLLLLIPVKDPRRSTANADTMTPGAIHDRM